MVSPNIPLSQPLQKYETTLAELFETAVNQALDRVWLSYEGVEITLRDTAKRVAQFTEAAMDAGIGPGDRVVTRVDNHPDYIAVILALAELGAVWVPIDIQAPARALEPRVALARPVAGIANPHHVNALRDGGIDGPILQLSEIRTTGAVPSQHRSKRTPDDHRAILFTSGTTGAPKGVIVTERMFCAAGCFAAFAGRAGGGQTFLHWEPLNHIGGAQMIPAALLSGARLALVERFSASRFWQHAKAARATRMHYLGGVLDLLAKQPPGPQDRDHGVTHAFGAAARPEMWSLFRDRFGISLTEVYGQTEAASFCIMNVDRIPGAIGRPLDEFEVALKSPDGTLLTDGAGDGEILLNASPPGLLSPGYLYADGNTKAAIRDGWFHTGDLARREADGMLRFLGRAKEAIRYRGENVTALEVETAVMAHPAVSECAAIGVPAEIGEEEILVVVTLTEQATLDPTELLSFLSQQLARFQVPRYLRITDEFPRTPSHRIAKSLLSRDVSEDWDAEAQ